MYTLYRISTNSLDKHVTDEFLPLCRPATDENDINALIDVVRSGWITTGPKNAALEKEISQLTGAPHVVALSSATAGMHLVLKALNIGPGDEVITPSLTWVSTANMICLAGAKPVFVDVDPNTLMVSSEQIEPLINKNTKLIIPVHYAGAALELDAIYDLAKKYDIPVVEDAAHALGAEYKGKPIGARGTCLFSLHAIKNISAGEGGLLTTFDAKIADAVRRLKFHGLGVDAFDRKEQGRSPQAEVIEPGFKYNLPDICAVLALGQLNRIDAITEKRRVLVEHYSHLLSTVSGITPLSIPSYPHKHCHHLMIVKVDPTEFGVDRNDLIELLKQRNIGSGIHFRPIHQQKYYRENYVTLYGEPNTNLNHTELVGSQICSLPLFPDMSLGDVERVVEAIKDIASKNEK
ncbi:aminotransferase class I/II-fold pyridoxal phosphate-dependent enzyme [Vibrio sp. S4M6]|uniref:aminotransferase class I/II-fold pyridoxal phosphate-dependent enzyme n=1 Tax=Vibrio sinus TaxID=2946865 RepID=UPI00202A1BE3|nr:aminotransferase class I/II-fold pyridoxal phosphate-dependent enzyme [Vibrio sinus]MCL9780056.1 aminotransferase class I/II-fold pyridoxal phosphate-dependent enzyme [Vibrio sinus]